MQHLPVLTIELPNRIVLDQALHSAIRAALEHTSSPICGQFFRLRFVVSGSERCRFALPIPIYGVGRKRFASASLLLYTACQPALRQQSLADLAHIISKLVIKLHAA